VGNNVKTVKKLLFEIVRKTKVYILTGSCDLLYIIIFFISLAPTTASSPPIQRRDVEESALRLPSGMTGMTATAMLGTTSSVNAGRDKNISYAFANT
jgi:hypothetical protein